MEAVYCDSRLSKSAKARAKACGGVKGHFWVQCGAGAWLKQLGQALSPPQFPIVVASKTGMSLCESCKTDYKFTGRVDCSNIVSVSVYFATFPSTDGHCRGSDASFQRFIGMSVGCLPS